MTLKEYIQKVISAFVTARGTPHPGILEISVNVYSSNGDIWVDESQINCSNIKIKIEI